MTVERIKGSEGSMIATGQKGEDTMLAGLGVLLCCVLFFRALSRWADHLEVSSSWLLASLTSIVAALIGLESWVHVIW